MNNEFDFDKMEVKPIVADKMQELFELCVMYKVPIICEVAYQRQTKETGTQFAAGRIVNGIAGQMTPQMKLYVAIHEDPELAAEVLDAVLWSESLDNTRNN